MCSGESAHEDAGEAEGVKREVEANMENDFPFLSLSLETDSWSQQFGQPVGAFYNLSVIRSPAAAA